MSDILGEKFCLFVFCFDGCSSGGMEGGQRATLLTENFSGSFLFIRATSSFAIVILIGKNIVLTQYEMMVLLNNIFLLISVLYLGYKSRKTVI